MQNSVSRTLSSTGVCSPATARAPRFHAGPPPYAIGDVHLRQQYFTYECELGLVTGCDFSVMFTIDRSSFVVWPLFKDFNLWQNSYGYYYSGVVGDLQGQTFALGPKDNLGPHRYEVIRVIPQQLIVISQPLPKEGETTGLPGLGLVSPGFHVFMLTEHEGKTSITILMEHASVTRDISETEALLPWREISLEWQRFWRDIFIPNLRSIVCGQP